MSRSPVGDDDATVAATGAVGRPATPAICTWREIGPETTPAAIVCGGEVNARVVGDHERKVRQPAVSAAPARSPAHHVPCAAAPHAPIPGSAGVSFPESLIAGASLSSTAAVWL